MHGVKEENRKEIRLQKAIAEAGLCSRRNAEDLIIKGLVRVNGEIATIGMDVDVAKDKILVNGQYLRPEKKIYLVLHKPRRYITTVSDPYGRKSVTALINEPQRVFPVGRLDKDTTGLLLLTNDGDFANQVMHPRYEVEKTYEVTLDKKIEDDEIAKFNEGVYLDRQFIELRVSKTGPKTVRVVVHTGLNKEIKRIFKQEGHWVTALRRTAIQGVQMHKLKEGAYRHLTKTEVQMLLTPRRKHYPPNGKKPAPVPTAKRTPTSPIAKSSGPGLVFVPNPKPYIPRDERKKLKEQRGRTFNGRSRNNSRPRTNSKKSAGGDRSPKEHRPNRARRQ